MRGVGAFQSISIEVARMESATQLRQHSRRSFVESLTQPLLATSLSLVVSPYIVHASGGATAGGAYLLSAKQRYNDRVKAGVKGFAAIQVPLEKGDMDTVRAFFALEEAGSWKDFSTAGYLLANAFRRSSNTPPDSLPSVKASTDTCLVAGCGASASNVCSFI